MTVGRTSESDICIAAGAISKRHARLFVDQGSLFVEDLGSTNGTYVNGKRVQQSPLIDGDLVQFANTI